MVVVLVFVGHACLRSCLPQVASVLSVHCVDFMKKLLSAAPSRLGREGFDEVKNHPWFARVRLSVGRSVGRCQLLLLGVCACYGPRLTWHGARQAALLGCRAVQKCQFEVYLWRRRRPMGAFA